jgi:hypothetical protein
LIIKSFSKRPFKSKTITNQLPLTIGNCCEEAFQTPSLAFKQFARSHTSPFFLPGEGISSQFFASQLEIDIFPATVPPASTYMRMIICDVPSKKMSQAILGSLTAAANSQSSGHAI